ncbi:MAG: exodeoxyribonuclease III [Gammaproteobacteria bacterium]|nr:exodeoxyribonuclease III [Gammaproteobacteria bacterium]
MKIITLNLNGIRAAARKGFYEWLADQNADIVCVQETKAQVNQLADQTFRPPAFCSYFYDAEKKGYSGVGLYSRVEPAAVSFGLGWTDFDAEARYLRADFNRVSVVSLYLPSGSSSPERQAAKFEFMQRFTPVLEELRREHREFLICGDWNIAHQKIDLKNWRANRKNSGFLPEERAWLDWVFGEAGFVDAFRRVNGHADQYTWWSNRGQAWAKNVGWRIDYQVATPRLADTVRSTSIYKDQRFSDHAPLIMDYDFSL